MSERGDMFFHKLQEFLQQDHRGVNIAVYGLAAAGLALSVHKVRPVSKFSKASKVPDHFIRKHKPLQGVYSGVQHTPLRVLVNHKAPIYLPLWHSSKPPLPVKLWGVEIVSGNAVNWLECVAKGQQVTLKPITRDNDDLVSTVLLHVKNPQFQTVETLDVGVKLVELGFAKTILPEGIPKHTFESKLVPGLRSAEEYAKSYRNGIWSDVLPPLPTYIVYWRKGAKLSATVATFTFKKLLQMLTLLSKGSVQGLKYVALLPIKLSRKRVKAT